MGKKSEPPPRRIDLAAYRKSKSIEPAKHKGPTGEHDRRVLLLEVYGSDYRKINCLKKNLIEISTVLIGQKVSERNQHHDSSFLESAEYADKLGNLEVYLYNQIRDVRLKPESKKAILDFANKTFNDASNSLAIILQKNPEFQEIIARNRPKRE